MKVLKGRLWASLGVLLAWVVFASLFSDQSFGAQTALVDTGALWRYLDDGSDQWYYWVDPWIDDSEWRVGSSPLGYGEPYIITQTAPGVITTYFRHTFNIDDLNYIVNPTIWVRRDDGVRIFLNGVPIFKDNLPEDDDLDYSRYANVAVEAVDYIQVPVDPFDFQAGANVLAVEIHQANDPNPDLVFDLKLFTDADIPGESPKITITAPPSGQMFRHGTNVLLSAAVSGTTNLIDHVDFFEGTTLLGEDLAAPYETLWSSPPLGSFQLRAVAVPTQGESFTSAPVQIVVVSNLPPYGNITSPENGEAYPEGNIRIEASGGDDDGRVVLAEFYANGIKIGEDSSPPFSITWSNASAGRYTLSASFTDNEGGAAQSEVVAIRVTISGGITRGPYLQMGTPHGIIVRWRTDVFYDSVVRYGSSPDALNLTASVPDLTTEHEVPLTGLLPDSKYYYSIGHSGRALAGGNDYFFVTAPDHPKSTRIWVIGDAGTVGAGDFGATLVRDAYYNYAGTRYTDLWLMLGDNAYWSGKDEEYQIAVFDTYPEILRQTVVWPTIGNHEAYLGDYLNIFSLPTQGEAGGVPSGVENYYSFDYGDVHFICLAGYYSGSLLSNGPMCTWLKQDLAANTNKWLIAFWHQPPYSKGTHDSDTEQGMIEMRENAVPILESFGVDLVLCGHSHVYERSYLLRGHYGDTTSFRPYMVLDYNGGQEDLTGPYVKPVSGPKANQGTVYVVAGSSGWTQFGWLDHPAMYRGWSRRGSLVLDIEGDTLRAKFLRETGAIDDYFTIQKVIGPRITKIETETGTVTIWWNSVVGTKYQLQFTTALGGTWQSVGLPVTADSSQTTKGHVAPPGSRTGFYRVVTVQ